MVKEKNKVNNSGTLVLFVMKYPKRKVVGKILLIVLLVPSWSCKNSISEEKKIKKVNRYLVRAKLYQLEWKLCYRKSGNSRCIICKMVVNCNGKCLTYLITGKFVKYNINSWHTWNDYKVSVWNFLTGVEYRLLVYVGIYIKVFILNTHFQRRFDILSLSIYSLRYYSIYGKICFAIFLTKMLVIVRNWT